MNDLISRQAAIDAIEVTDWYHQNRNGEMVKGANSQEHQAWYKAEDVYKVLEGLPSAQQWIPCSERLPEEDFWSGRGRQFSNHVLVTIVNHANDDEQFTDIAQTVDGIWQLSHDVDGDCSLPNWCEVIAWMFLPEPYKGEES